MTDTLIHGVRIGGQVALVAARFAAQIAANRAAVGRLPIAAAPPVNPPAPGGPPGNPAGAPATSPATSSTTAAGIEFPDVYLSMLVWAGAIFALIVLFLPERTATQRGRIRTTAMLGTGFVLLMTVFGFNTEIANDTGGGLPTAHDERRAWLSGLGMHADYHFTADGVSLALLAAVALLFVVAVIASLRMQHHIRLYFGLLLMLETGVVGVLTANDLLLFLLFWGMQIVPMYLLIVRWGGAGAAAAGRRYLHHALIAFGLLIAGTVILAAVADQGTFDLQQIAGANLPYGLAMTAFLMLFGGFAIAMGAFPLHGWLTDSQAEASAPVAAIVGGAAVTVAGYGMIRVVLQALGPMSSRFSFLIVVIAVLTAAFGAFTMVRQHDLRRAVSHFAVAQSGVVLLAIGCHSTVAVVGAVTLLIANAFAIAAMHLVAAAVEDRTRTGRIDRLGGMYAVAPRLTAFWIVAAMSALGVPLLAGFSGVFLVVTGSFHVHRVATAAVLVLLFVSGGALIRLTQRVYFGPLPEEFARAYDVDANELWQFVPLAVALMLWGVLPGRVMPMLSNAVVQSVARHIGGAGG